MRGWPVEEFRALIAEEIEPLAALAFPDAIPHARPPGAREQAIVVSASLVDLVEPLAQRLGLDGGHRVAREIRDGRYTGRARRSSTGAKAEAVRARCETGIDLAASSAYTDSRSDIELLQTVGHPFAVNPDRALGKARLATTGRCCGSLGPAPARGGGGSASARVEGGSPTVMS